MLPPVLCFSPFAWSSPSQRPQTLMKRFSTERRVFFIEEATLTTGAARLALSCEETGVLVCTPQLPDGHPRHITDGLAAALISELVRRERIERPIAWVFTPTAGPMLGSIDATTIIYDRLHVSAHGPLSAHDAALDAAIIERANLVFDDEKQPVSSRRSPPSERQTARDLSWWRTARSVTARQVPAVSRTRSTTAPMI